MRPIAIRSIGMVTPGASDANGSAALIYTETQTIDDLPRISVQPTSAVGTKTPLSDDVVGVDRLVRLGSSALWEAVDDELAGKPIALLVCAPSAADEPEVADDPGAFLRRLAAESQLLLAMEGSKVFASGRQSMIHALPFAVAALQRHGLAAVCLLGVDSLVTKPRLRLALQRGTPPASILAEAAAAVVLTSAREPNSMAELCGMGIAEDSSARTGSSMLAAIDRAIADARLGKPAFDVLVHDMTGAPSEYEELAWVKTGQALADSVRMDTLIPGRSVGNSGAALPVLSFATLAFLMNRVDAYRTGLCCLGSEGPRAALILVKPQGSRPSR